MICKWCGAAVDAAMKKCPTCGREIPPLSDCGGFYRVVPTAAQAAKQWADARPRPESSPHGGVPPMPLRPTESLPPQRPAPKTARRAPLLALLSLVLLAVLCVFVLLRFSAIDRRLSALEKDRTDIRPPFNTAEETPPITRQAFTEPLSQSTAATDETEEKKATTGREPSTTTEETKDPTNRNPSTTTEKTETHPSTTEEATELTIKKKLNNY